MGPSGVHNLLTQRKNMCDAGSLHRRALLPQCISNLDRRLAVGDLRIGPASSVAESGLVGFGKGFLLASMLTSACFASFDLLIQHPLHLWHFAFSRNCVVFLLSAGLPANLLCPCCSEMCDSLPLLVATDMQSSCLKFCHNTCLVLQAPQRCSFKYSGSDS